jgi:DNA-binding SARP family transcriptional activator/predicted ATPase
MPSCARWRKPLRTALRLNEGGMPADFTLSLLGPIQLERSGAPLQGIRSRKALAVLSFLAVSSASTTRAALAALFWPQLPGDRALNNLSWAIGHLNRQIPGCITTEHAVVRCGAPSALTVDLLAFRALLAQADRLALAQAVALYRGELMQDFALDGCPQFELWLLEEREYWRQQVIQALERLIAQEQDRGDTQQALAHTLRLLEIDPYREQAQRVVMALLALDGQRSAALAQYDSFARSLQSELGIEPEAETQALYLQIRAGTLLAGAAEAEASAALRASNWPHPRAASTSFVGRQAELASSTKLLTSEGCRLLTIVGPGGIGKTRLALQLAAQVQSAFAQGVLIVPLEKVSSSEALVFALAEALKLAFVSNADPREQLLGLLATRQLLLIFDSFEHVLDGADLVLELLNRAPEVCVLITSRVRLQLQAERLIVLRGLELPEHDEAAGWRNTAVQLFEERAALARPGFRIVPEQLSAVLALCQLVEGSPLGIELAARHADRLAPAAITQAIRENLDLLSTSQRDLPERQRSLRAVFASAWADLPPAQQRSLAQLAVFRGSFSAPAALAVANAGVAVLTLLEEQALLRRLSSGRYELPELLGIYAKEQLATRWEHSLEGEAYGRHSAFYLARVSGAEAELHDPAGAGSAELQRDLDNLLQAWSWAVEHATINALTQAVRGMARLFAGRSSRYREIDLALSSAAERLRALIGRATQPDRDLALLLTAVALCQIRFLVPLLELDRAASLLTEVMPLAQRFAAPALEAEAWCCWGSIYTLQARYAEARSSIEQGLGLARSLILKPIEARGLFQLAQLSALQGLYDQGEDYAHEALRLYRVIGDRAAEQELLSYLSSLAGYKWGR